MLGDRPKFLFKIHIITIVHPKQTFINAFELSPVHCLKFRPSGNRRRPTKGGAIAILIGMSVQISDEV
jgi:hypothetical protein